MSIKLKDTIYDLVKSSENSDTLDGKHLSGLYYSQRGNISSTTLNTYTSRDSGTYGVTYSDYSGLLAVLSRIDSNSSTTTGSTSSLEFLADHYRLDNGLKVRTSIDGKSYSTWKTLAFTSDIPEIGSRNIPINGTKYTVYSSVATDTAAIYAPTVVGTSGYVLKSVGKGAPEWTSQSSLSVGSAVTAQKLTTQTATAWGKSYFLNGIPQNISGNMTDVGNITFTRDTDGRGIKISTTGNISMYSSSAGGSAMGITAKTNSGESVLGTLAGVLMAKDVLTYTYYGGTSYDSPAMVITSGKYVGIGTTTPSHPLQVVGTISATNVTASTFVKSGSSNNYVLLGGGGTKAVSDFATSSHSHNYAGSQSNGGPADSVVCITGNTDVYRSIVVTAADNKVYYNTKVLANYGTGKLKAVGYVISSTESSPHIEFSRVGWNYLKVPSGGSLAVSINGNDGTTSRLVVTSDSVYPGYTTGTVSLGTSSYPWGTVYGNTFSGNAASASKLATSRTINGTSFNGTSDITTSSWGKERTITIGNTGKKVDGSKDISWTLSEIGASATGHTHSYIPLSGGNITGSIIMNGQYDTAPFIRNFTFTSSSGWARSLASIQVDGKTKFSIGAYGSYTTGSSSNGITYAYIGCGTSYDSLYNLRFTSSDIKWGNSLLLHEGNWSTWCAAKSHTHNYAGSSSAGGPAISVYTDSISDNTSNHGTVLKNYFSSNKSSIPRNKLISYYSAAHGNGSQYFGYFLTGYNDTPYGGFFVAHYGTPYYVGISYGSFTEQTILTSSNYSSWCASKSHTHDYAAKSHTHTIAQVTNLQSSLDNKSNVGHTHSYLPLSGGTMTGVLYITDNNSYISSTTGSAILAYGTSGTFTGAYSTSTKSSIVGSIYSPTVVRSSGDNLYHYNDENSKRYLILDEYNCSSYCAAKSHTHSYLPLSGGIMTGTIQSTASTVLQAKYSGTYYNTIVNHANGNISISAAGSGLYLGYTNTTGIYCRGSYVNIDSGNYTSYCASKDHTHSGYAAKDHTHSYLPLSGGTITGTLNIQRSASAICYKNSGGTVWGWLGFNALDTPVAYMGNGSTVYKLLHENNWSTWCAAKSHSHSGYASSSHTHSAADITSGTLAVARGGTGKTTLQDACNALINALSEGTSAPVDKDFYVAQYAGGGTSTTTYHRRPVSALYSYMKGKMDSVYAAKSHTHSYAAATTRNICINASKWTVYSSITTDTTPIYAPTSVGSSGQILVSSGATSGPTWGNIATTSTTNTDYPLIGYNTTNKALIYKSSGLTINPSTGLMRSGGLVITTNTSYSFSVSNSSSSNATTARIESTSTGNYYNVLLLTSKHTQSSSSYATLEIKVGKSGGLGTGGCAINTNGWVQAAAHATPSDRRLKYDINKLSEQDDIVKLVDNFDLVSFRKKESNELSYGLIAQDVYKYFPSVVGYDTVTGYYNLDYNSCLILKIANLERKIKELKEEIEVLKNK